ncbi:bifunctional adenosylcobinamide kinase/adenosylcobinamide-phosphate guanylyltransferase [Methylomarinum sp. Ch1-1]|uniref:Bifunctional adenosylcobalamin biosynthesis protein n=1 Tax=Methylomarinum roseum TaxID=3067653 RepID=A0AAU7NVI2_9GAMM
MIELVLGGARSGKSRYAERQALAEDKAVIYVATAEVGDDEMQSRIARHRADRPEHWLTVEEPIRLADTIKLYTTDDSCLLIDCLTLWLSNVLFDRRGGLQFERFQQEKSALLSVLQRTSGRIIMVSNEVGHGVVPMQKNTRRFVDEAGRLHQDIARICDRVVLVTAGLPQVLKSP